MDRPTRRTHIKSRDGCSTCKRRRVRCDEFKPTCQTCLRLNFECHYPIQRLTGANAVECSGGNSTQKHTGVFDIGEAFTQSCPPVHSTATQRIPPCIAQFSHIRPVELATIGEVISRVDAMHETNTLSIFWGTKLLPELVPLALQDNGVRHGLCCLRSSELANMTYDNRNLLDVNRYRQMALADLRAGLDITRLDCALATSWLLSWVAPTSDEFAVTMDGVNTILTLMDQLSYNCSLRSFFLVTSQKTDVSERVPTTLYTKAQLLEIIQVSLKDLQDLCSSRKDLKQAVKQMYNVSVNWEKVPPVLNGGKTQLKGLYPIRSPMPWLPSMTIDVLNKDPLDILFAAHYNMLAIGCNLVSPAVKIPFGLISRAHTIIDVVDRLIEPPEWNSTSGAGKFTSDVMRRCLAGPMTLAHYILASEDTTSRKNLCAVFNSHQ